MIGRGERWCYAAGDLGFNFVWQSTELYLLFFYVRVLHFTPALAAAIFMAGAVADWVADPFVGALADRAAPRIGLRRWVLVGGPASTLTLVAAFTPPPFPTTLVPVAALVTYLLLRVAYSVGNVPYAALTARLSDARADHLALTGARMQGAALGGLIAGLTYLLLPAQDGGADFKSGALLLAVLSLPAFLATGLGVTERVTPAPPAPGVRAVGLWPLLRRSASLRRLLSVIFAAGLAVTALDNSLLFLFDALGLPRLGYLVALAPSASLLVTGREWSRLGLRFGQMQILLAATVLTATTAALAALVAPAAIVVAALVGLAIVAGRGISVMFWSMVPATVAACETVAGGQGCAGRVYALANITRKLAAALGPLLLIRAVDGSARALLIRVVGGAAFATLTVALAARSERRTWAPGIRASSPPVPERAS